ncbi:MAG TPA: NADH-quinone oxidoreductase subunit L, partial [Gammaproteobacteria bacterium]|nr:NADH-quinone oxidoreductase subunit L [Gammaproteobacteria bacterium]HJN00597.1 NADH-quinone oxidoreductase subunit L [Gammaproteobacteria bacterium]
MIFEYSLIALLSPLVGSILAAFLGKSLGKTFVNTSTILGVMISFVLSCILALEIYQTSTVLNQNIYTWLNIGSFSFHIGFLIDNLTASMMVVVTFVSLMVHIYTIGYMHDDPGYHRFFAYISLFTFSMLSLVMANNFLQLFFGWEAVGVMSYLLIGFWYTKESAIKANLKAFLVNRVGDLSMILGIGIIFSITGSLDYQTTFFESQNLAQTELFFINEWNISALTASCMLLFGGAMGKSAQMPLHVWLPDSMEGPTPISALIHAATMVTAGVFLLARMSPLFELSSTALSFVLIIGATTALFTGILGLIQNDIKRVIAYSTLSQLGYMVAAAGVSAYSVSLFHLMTHAFFKALLFLAAGSVIVALHHEQDIRKMGGLKSKLPITYVTSLIGSLALIGFPGFSGFFSKDALIEAIGHADIFGSGFAYASVIVGVFITALYSFRLFFKVFHGSINEHHSDVKESPVSITLPLILLAIPSVMVAWPTVGPMVFGSYFATSIAQPDAYQIFGYEYSTAYGFL